MRQSWLAAGLAATSCIAPAPTNPEAAPHPAFALRPRGDPTVRGARFVPESLDLTTAVAEPSGSARGLVEGVRFRVKSGGFPATADERIEDVSVVLPLPGRLGGGVLFVRGDTLYRADDWLGPTRPVFRSSSGVVDAFAGLDRVYLATKTGAHIALDGVSGARLDLGPWPADPIVGSYAALDGWHAVALTDVQGAVGTTDAGRTWSKLDVPFQPRAVLPVGRNPENGAWLPLAPDMMPEAFLLTDGALRAPDPRLAQRPPAQGAPARCCLVDGALAVTCPSTCGEVPVGAIASPSQRVDVTALGAALEDGWPLDERNAIVARDGTLLRISLADGAIAETIADAFDPAVRRCHAVPLPHPGEPSAFGFVCSTVTGGTALLVYDDAAARARTVRTFETPRVVHTSSTGSWLVEGPCGDRGPGPRASYCLGVSAPSALSGTTRLAWREISVDDAPGAIVAITSDAKLARVSPRGRIDGATLSIISADGATNTVAVRLGEAGDSVRRFAARAQWTNGLQERQPGILSGWLAAEGSVLGVELDRAGNVRAGAFVRDLGSVFVAGRYGLGWTRQHRGYETTDGGMTWVPFAAPTSLAPSRVRACGPLGCTMEGWFRVGWGERLAAPAPVLDLTPAGVADRPATVSLACDPAAATESWPTSPARSAGGDRLEADLFPAFEQPPFAIPLGRILVWGPRSGDWAGRGRWSVRWRSPFGGRATFSSASATAPFQDAEDARAELGLARVRRVSMGIDVSEDEAHALLRRAHGPPRGTDLSAIDEGGAAVPITRSDGAPWAEVDAAIRVGGSWVLAAPDPSQRGSIELLLAEGGVAHRIATVPRHLASRGSGGLRLAREEGGTRIGVVVEGERLADGNVNSRWVVPVELASGSVDAPEGLGAVDLRDRESLAACEDHGGTGWVVDVPWPFADVRIDLGNEDAPVRLHQVFARLRMSSSRACIERLAGNASSEAVELGRAAPRWRTRPLAAELTLALVVTGTTPEIAMALACGRSLK